MLVILRYRFGALVLRVYARVDVFACLCVSARIHFYKLL